MEDDPTIKKVRLTGAVADEYDAAGGSKRKSRKKREPIINHRIQKVDREEPMTGAGATSPGTMVQLAATHVPGSSSARIVGIGSNLTASGALVDKVAPAAPTGPVGGAPQKVILSKTKKKGIVLAAPKVQSAAATTTLKGRKAVKKFNVSVGNLTRKLHKAKTIRAKADKHTFADIKNELVAAGLIKAESKAPEPILRQMYSDFMVLKRRAL
jgi:hypothetical protein